ncbi:MAG TPA: type II toxin-antitoxin system ParD family antitoxin [Rhizomicrobium sp.]|nr:type II toxin-antitoxin system ParD family antitoxin [Rhizomicrobium sp.]
MPISKIEKISVALPSEMVAAIREAVASGDYATNSDVMRDALRDWRMRRRVEEIELEEMRRLVKEGIDSGPSLDGKAELARLKAKYVPIAKADNE